MIISHRHRFVYVKTRKTASTSLEIALSAVCGPDDVITKIMPQDEAVRRSLGVRGPQNEIVHDQAGVTFELVNHAPAAVARDLLGPAWNDYFTFTIERNPFDRVISQFAWERSILPPHATFASFLRTTPPERLSNWHLYADPVDTDRVIVDHVGRYESLTESLAYIAEAIGLPGGIVLPAERTKSHLRTDRRHHRDVLSAEDRQIVETLCQRELSAFGYAW
jgi:hypothetical protein